MKSKLITMLLCWFLGTLGIHRFYLGKVWTGILYLCTAGLCGVGTVIDMILLLFNAMKDKEGNKLKNDIPTSIIIILFILWLIIMAVIGLVSGLFEWLGALLFI